MKYNIKLKITNEDIYNSSLNFLKSSKTFYFDIIFNIVAFAALYYTIYNGAFFSFDSFRKILIIICPLIFPVIQPIILYIKSFNNINLNTEIELEFNENNIIIMSSKEHVTINYIDVYNFIKFKNMHVLMYDSVHGQIIPDRFLTFDKNVFYNFVSGKIKEARNQ